jgi:hypothetical protein
MEMRKKRGREDGKLRGLEVRLTGCFARLDKPIVREIRRSSYVADCWGKAPLA